MPLFGCLVGRIIASAIWITPLYPYGESNPLISVNCLMKKANPLVWLGD